MAKKTATDLIIELKELFLEREIKFLDKMLTIDTTPKTSEETALREELDKEELKWLKQLKSRLNYVEKLNNQLTGKTGKERTKGEEELWGRIIEMESSVGKIVRSIPQTGTD